MHFQELPVQSLSVAVSAIHDMQFLCMKEIRSIGLSQNVFVNIIF